MKRGLLIAGGTLGGLGAVMAITPPQLSATSGLAVGGSSAMGVATAPSPAPAASTSTTATPMQSATTAAATKATVTKAASAKAGVSKATVTKVASATTNSNSNNSNSSAVATDPTPTKTVDPAPTKTVDPAPTPTKSATPTPVQTQTSKGVTGKFIGPAIFVNYGTVQVEITVKDGHITDAAALQAPTGRNDRWTNMALPILKKQTLAAQSDAIQGASGASYTSYGWYKSLQGALAKAGL